MRHTIAVSILALSCCASIPAYSQDYVENPVSRRDQISTVQSSFTSSTPLDEKSDVASLQVESMRNFYKMAENSCAEVLATIASKCEIFRLNTTVNVSEIGSRGRMLTVNGQITMRVSFKDQTGKPAQ